MLVKDAQGAEMPLGGFAEVSFPRKVGGLYKAGDVTLKRGVVSSQVLFNWLHTVRSVRDSVLMLRDEAGAIVGLWKISKDRVTKYEGPPLDGKGGADVAMEELVIGYERLEWIPPK